MKPLVVYTILDVSVGSLNVICPVADGYVYNLYLQVFLEFNYLLRINFFKFSCSMNKLKAVPLHG